MSATSKTGDLVRVSVSVRVPIEDAFRIFTEEIDQWWRRGVAFRVAGRRPGVIHFEPKLGGRLFEEFDVRGSSRLIELGRIVEWSPPSHFAFEWRGVNFAPSESTRVDVTFVAKGSGTFVEVTHSGWSQLRPDHPARHGQEVVPFIRTMGLWWGDLLTSLRLHATS